MADYKAPLRDMRFVLNEVFEVAKLWAQLPALADTVDAETVEAILEEAGKVTSKSIAPSAAPLMKKAATGPTAPSPRQQVSHRPTRLTLKVVGSVSAVIRCTAAWACPRPFRPRSRRWSTPPACPSVCTRC